LGLDGVEFRGPVYGDYLHAILRRAVAIVVPTEWYDNSPLVVHQAFALGKAVIASDIDGIPEIVADGENGLLFPPGDFTQLAERMKRILGDEDLQQRLGRNARRKAEREFTSDNRFEGLMRVIAFAREMRIQPHE
jgi:glycosyltransferase involved in cell wall biosynthesis